MKKLIQVRSKSYLNKLMSSPLVRVIRANTNFSAMASTALSERTTCASKNEQSGQRSHRKTMKMGLPVFFASALAAARSLTMYGPSISGAAPATEANARQAKIAAEREVNDMEASS